MNGYVANLLRDALSVAGTESLSFLVGSGMVWLSVRLLSRLRNRHAWRLSDPASLTIVVSFIEPIETGEYRRPATGIGVMRALAVLAPSLSRAYRGVNFEAIYPSNAVPRERLEGDLLVLGGPKHNEIADQLLRRAQSWLPIAFVGSGIQITDGEAITECHARLENEGQVAEDVGLLLSMPNPDAAPEHPRRVVLLGGAHTWGQVAAARRLVDHHRGLRPPRGEAFAEVVRARVEHGHVFPPIRVFSRAYQSVQLATSDR